MGRRVAIALMLCVCVGLPVFALANHGGSSSGRGTDVRTEAAAAGVLSLDRTVASRASRSADRLVPRAGAAGETEQTLLSIDDSGDVGIALAADAVAGNAPILPITTEPPARATSRATSTTVRKRASSTTTTTRKPTTTTTVRPTTTTTAKPRNTQVGQASWYQTYNGTCAHLTIPMGTLVTVTNLDNGMSVVCRVADRGPHVAGRIIDLDKELFDDLAPPSSGVLNVRLSWS